MTCRKIYIEAHKYLFRRPLVFRGQLELYGWLEKVPSKYLQSVTEITLEIHDVDLQPLLRIGTSAAQRNNTPRLLTVELYKKDLERLFVSLSRLPNVKELTIRTKPERQSPFYRDFIGELFARLSFLWPSIRGLSLEGNVHHQNLSFLNTLPNLRCFLFDGFSSSSSINLAETLSSLQRLQSLSLVSHHKLLTPTNPMHSGFTSKQPSFTDDVLRSMHRLVSLSITESIYPLSSPALFFTPKMVSSLLDHTSLNSLTIRISREPDSETLAALKTLLKASSIKRLELDWPPFETKIFEYYDLYPNSLTEFWVRADNASIAFDILFPIRESQEAGKMRELERIVFIRETWYDDTAAIIIHKEGNYTDIEVDTREAKTDRGILPLGGTNTPVSWSPLRLNAYSLLVVRSYPCHIHSNISSKEHNFASVASISRDMHDLGTRVLWHTENV